VKARVDALTEGKIPYHMAYNGAFLGRGEAEALRIQDGDKFLVLPVVLGG
jgi:sulfur carrier protein ThiS